ncbi:group II intron reverse transcriptase/maturase [Bdellovibrionota bacterium FG-2]
MSTQHRDQSNLHTKLDRVEQRSRQDRKATFNNLGHLLDLEMLGRCHHALDGAKAVGIDGVTKEDYEENLDQNLKDLLMKVRRGSYHPQASRIVEIPKTDGSTRPLAISCHEDKIVQEALRQVLERIYEPIFLDCSHGFRPRRGCDTALVALGGNLKSKDCGAILEIDLRKYFNTIPHEPLIRLLKLKIEDQRFLHLIIKMIQAPTLKSDGVIERNEVGSPQGSILSPIIANLYLHYVMDIWFHWLNSQEMGGGARLVRYADDAVFTFRDLSEAERFRLRLAERLKSFGISMNEDKTKVLPCGQKMAARYAKQGRRMPTFVFLGFLHVWGTAWNRKAAVHFWRIKRRTCPKRFRKKLSEIQAHIKKHRHEKTLLKRITQVVRGYLNYFAVNDNQRRAKQFLREVRRMLFKWLNRRSQKRSITWKRLGEVLEKLGFPNHPHMRNLFFV